jgi:outer membrane protein assembly factor BamD (BamD/ComL family)
VLQGLEIALVADMKTLCTLLLIAAPVTYAQTAARPPDQVLYDEGLRFETQQRLERARLLLRTLTLTYPESPYAAKANKELTALTLLLTAQTDIADGRTKRADLSLRTLMNTYPQSPLAAQAEATLKTIR